MEKKFKIADRVIGAGHPVFIIAEMSANHNSDLDIAIKTLKAAKEAGADAIKLQTFTADTITIDCDNEYFKIKGGTLWDGRTLYDLYKEAAMPWDWHFKLKQIADELGLLLFSSPFDPTSVDFLDELGVPAYKIASFEITDIPLIEHVAQKGKPIIISTGIATFEDIKDAVEACNKHNNHQIALLKCTSAYPAPYEDIQLKAIPFIEKQFNTIVGLSDHTLGEVIPIASVAVGACIIEKHFILDKKLGGLDAEFSMNPTEFKKMVESIRNVSKALGKEEYKPEINSLKNRIFSRSLFVVSDMKKGDLISEKNVRSIRPGNGLHPKYLPEIKGKKVRKDLLKGSPFELDFIDN